MKWERLCLWCKHFTISEGYSGTPGYSDMTPGLPSRGMDLFCHKDHWQFESRDHDITEDEYRAALLTAVTCRDYEMLDDILALIAQHTQEK